MGDGNGVKDRVGGDKQGRKVKVTRERSRDTFLSPLLPLPPVMAEGVYRGGGGGEGRGGGGAASPIRSRTTLWLVVGFVFFVCFGLFVRVVFLCFYS